MIKNINLVLVTEESMILENDNEISLSLAMGIISSYLEEKGMKAHITDTNKRAVRHIYSEKELKLISAVYDKDRVINYIKTGKDRRLDALALMFLECGWEEYDSYGISIGADFSMLQIHLGFILAAFLKGRTGRPVFIGGNNLSYIYIFRDFYKELLETAAERFLYIIKGPGEQVIWEIVDSLNHGKSIENICGIDGLLRLVNGEVIANKEREPMVIKPNWDSLNMEDYGYPFMKRQNENENIFFRFPMELTNKIAAFHKMNEKERKIVIPYIFNYNCIYKCAFCTQSDSDRCGLIVGEVKQVVDDIECLSKKYHSNYFYFLNNYFPSSMEFIQAFKAELQKRNLQIYWSDCGRINGLTLEKIKLLWECGCRKLVFGFESGSQKILDLIDKRINLTEMVSVLKWCKEVGIWADVEVIIGLPYEREEEFLSTYDFLDKFRDYINNFWLNEYFVIPNSLIGKHPERYGVALIKGEITYEGLAKKNEKGFLEKNYRNLTSNARLWGFYEINGEEGRSYGQMRKENSEKMIRLAKLRNPEFNQLFDFYNRIIRNKQKIKEEKAC